MTTKLHVCCGGVRLDGYVNVDKYPFETGDDSRSGCVADLLADVFDLPFAKGSVSEIVLVHGMEHFTRYDGERLLGLFADLLAPDGVLYLEMPSRNPVFFLTAVERLAAALVPRTPARRFGRGLASAMLWGNQWAGFDYETHRYLWTPAELARFAAGLGLSRSELFRYPASHVPFRDMGLVLGRGDVVARYQPPRIRRAARKGLAGSMTALVVGTAFVVRETLRPSRAAEL